MVESIKTGQPKGYSVAGRQKPKSEADILNEELQRKLVESEAQNKSLEDKVRMLELRISELEGRPKSRQYLENARMTDSLVNGEKK